MNEKDTIDAIIELDGVYGAFFSSHDDQSIVAKVPSDYPADILQAIAFHGEETLEQIRAEFKDCHEVRLDMGHITVLMFLLPGGIMFAMIYKQDIIESLRNQVYGLCKSAEKAHRKRMLLTARIGPPSASVAELTEKSHQSSSPPVLQPMKPVKPVLPMGAEPKSRYTREALIGEGGEAEVYRAYDTRLDREVALKRFKERFTGDPKESAIAELRCGARVTHQNIVGTYDMEEDEKGHFLVMELIEGENLQTLLEEKPLDLTRFNEVAVQALEALVATHAAGLLHLDLKPSNFMLSTDGGERTRLKLIDFGQAALLADAPRGKGVSGSIYYASPEYFNESEVDERADLYSLGCVFYHALAGERPFGGESALMIMAAHIRHDVEDLVKKVPGIPEWLSQWVMSLIAVEPTSRPESAKAALEQFLKQGQNTGDEVKMFEAPVAARA